MKKILSVFLAIVIATSLLSLCGCSSDRITINVYSWGEYISDGSDGSLDVIEEFTERTGIEVNYTTYSTNEELYAKLSAGGSDYDVIIPSDYMIGKLINEGMLEKLDYSNIPNYADIDESFKGLNYDVNNEYTVPYMWGTVGIFYNKTMVDQADIDKMSWDILWNEKYSGKILMFDNARDSFAIALKKLGYSMNTTDENEIRAAYSALSEQKPLLQAYVMDQIFNKMANNEAALAPYYAGDYIMMSQDNENVGYFVPKEGTNRFVDAMCIPVGSKHKTEAEMFINFMCETEISVANSEYIGYSTPVKSALSQLDPAIAQNPIYYPSAEVLANTELYATLPAETYTLMEDLWIKLKAE